MKKNMFMVAALVGALAMPAISQGAATVWFEYVGGDGAPTSGGGPGETLVIEKPNAPGTYHFTINMVANVTDVGIYGNITTLLADGPVAASDLTVVPPPGGAPNAASGLGTPGPGPIAVNFGGAVFSGNGYLGPDLLMATIDLTIVKLGGEMGDVGIYPVIGTTLWGDQFFGAPDVSFGPNGPVSGAVAGAGANGLPSVVIHWVPEPATLSLLGLGAIALIRRRRN
jgi:hypothetical protein